MKKYVVVIGDIIKSRELDNRSEVQYQFKSIIDKLNQKYQNDIVYDVKINLGDEVQGVFKLGKSFINFIEELEMEMYPIKIRFGIGYGEIENDYITDNTLEMDGKAYHYARAMIEEIKIQESKNSDSFTFIKFRSGHSTDSVINSIFILSSTLKDKWTSRQREIISYYSNNNENQYQVAEKLGVNQSTINRSLKASNYYNYRDAMNNLKRFLNRYEVSNDD